MGLDVYVGPLSRYYSGQWETILQQLGRQSGLHVEVVRPTQPKISPVSRLIGRLTGHRVPPDPATLVAKWWATLCTHAPVGALLMWNDSVDGEYFTDKPAWDCYGALVLRAAYDEAPPAQRLVAATDKWSKDPSYVNAIANPASRYRHLIANTELWLPVEFDPPFEAPMPVGDRAVIGSSVRLLSELRALNQNCWRASDGDIDGWRQEGAEYGAPLERSAMFGFAVFYTLACKSTALQLPMKLDY
ncbi:MAG: hypothetical protein HYX75_19270 [Acidobacteria bacterium]|nr:hypothetical protein [Acidobacteriota bacterium]